MPVVNWPHPLHVLTWLDCACSTYSVDAGKGDTGQVNTATRTALYGLECFQCWLYMLCHNSWRAHGVCALESSSFHLHFWLAVAMLDLCSDWSKWLPGGSKIWAITYSFIAFALLLVLRTCNNTRQLTHDISWSFYYGNKYIVFSLLHRLLLDVHHLHHEQWHVWAEQ